MVSATRTLFDQGLADPRGCVYRDIEVVVGATWGGAGGVMRTHGWVLPAAKDAPQRFAVCWSGVVYPAVSVGAEASLEADVQALAASARKVQNRGFDRDSTSEAFAVAHDALLSIKVCLLLRLDRADLAESLWEPLTGFAIKPGAAAPAHDLTSYHLSYLTLATDWAWYHFERAVCAQMRGDDGMALASTRALVKMQDAIEAKAAAMGFPRRSNAGQPAPYLDFLRQLPEFAADQERRAREPARAPVPPPGAGDKSLRIAALIRNLDQVSARQWGQPGGVTLGEDPIVKALIFEGDDAVEPLIDALEHDVRLTRSIHFWRDFDRHRTILGAHEAAYTALAGILKTSFFGAASTGDDLSAQGKQGRAQTAARIRAYWDQYKAVPLVERWYRILADDRAGSGAWLQAAGNIVQPENVSIVPGSMAFVTTMSTPLPPGTKAKLRGEALREKKEPSVATLMAQRVESMRDQSGGNLDVSASVSMAHMLAVWDAQAALPTLRELARVLFARRKDQGTNITGSLAAITMDRLRANDGKALSEYVHWLRDVPPESSHHQFDAQFEPIWRKPNDPTIAEDADWLFNDPKSPWSSLLDKRHASDGFQRAELITSPLVGVPAFRKSLIAALGDKTRLGKVTVDKEGDVNLAMDSGGSSGRGQSKVDPLAPAPGVEVPFRVGDFYAWTLSTLEGAPECELYWPEARRDQAITECVAFLTRYGERFAFADSDGRDSDDFLHRRAHMTFPLLDHPATPEDVAKGRAIFSLEGQGERRVVAVVDRPLTGNWLAYKAHPTIQRPVNPKTGPITVYDQAGRVWQAEEVLKDGKWQRFYGFIGRYVIAKAPADEIEFREWRLGLQRLSDTLEGNLLTSGAPTPTVFRLRLRNASGLDRSIPTEFVRMEEGKVVALRKGITLQIARASVPAPSKDEDWAPVPLSSITSFDPTGRAQILRPAESFEAMSIDLKPLFASKEPGHYRLRLTFAKESGIADGASLLVQFEIGTPAL